jgi:phosphate-selective porin OprO/OprP
LSAGFGTRRGAAAILLLLAVTPALARAQGASGEPQEPEKTIDTTVEAGEADAEVPRRRLVHWNEYDLPGTTFRFGGGILLDAAAYAQDADSKAQIAMEPDAGLRDFRILLKGRFKTARPFSWSLGYMYDGTDKEWRFRQTGVMIGFPELSGSLFIGRTKEGYSLIKVMVGYHGWTMERSPALDAFVPILADGLKWMGYHPGPRIFYNLGYYGDRLSEEEKFSTYDRQAVARIGWLPILSEKDGRLLHVAVMARDGTPDEGTIQVRSRPEAYLAPYFLDTGKIASEHARTTGVESYYRSGPWLFGGEYNWQAVDPDGGRQVVFQAGDAVLAWIITGETRPYNAPGGYFEAVSPERTVFEGGPGAWEAVFHFSYTDFDAGPFQGGKFWRFTPMVNWHMSDNLRLELAYGYGTLDRFDLEGHTQFFQFRLQAIF